MSLNDSMTMCFGREEEGERVFWFSNSKVLPPSSYCLCHSAVLAELFTTPWGSISACKLMRAAAHYVHSLLLSYSPSVPLPAWCLSHFQIGEPAHIVDRLDTQQPHTYIMLSARMLCKCLATAAADLISVLNKFHLPLPLPHNLSASLAEHSLFWKHSMIFQAIAQSLNNNNNYN